jgi:hypothetical protein
MCLPQNFTVGRMALSIGVVQSGFWSALGAFIDGLLGG